MGLPSFEEKWPILEKKLREKLWKIKNFLTALLYKITIIPTLVLVSLEEVFECETLLNSGKNTCDLIFVDSIKGYKNLTE